MQSVEVGIETAFCGLKWKAAIEAKKTARDALSAPQPVSQAETTAIEPASPAVSTMPRPFFSDSVAGQPPVVPTEPERSLEKT